MGANLAFQPLHPFSAGNSTPPSGTLQRYSRALRSILVPPRFRLNIRIPAICLTAGAPSPPLALRPQVRWPPCALGSPTRYRISTRINNPNSIRRPHSIPISPFTKILTSPVRSWTKAVVEHKEQQMSGTSCKGSNSIVRAGHSPEKETLSEKQADPKEISHLGCRLCMYVIKCLNAFLLLIVSLCFA